MHSSAEVDKPIANPSLPMRWVQRKTPNNWLACMCAQKPSKSVSEGYEMVHKPGEGQGAESKNGVPDEPVNEETIEQLKLLLKNGLSGGAM